MERLRSIATVKGGIIALIFCASLLLLAMYPYRPDHVLGWVVLIAVSVPTVIGLEILGGVFVQNKVPFHGKGRLARIAFGFAGILVICIVLLVIWHLAKPFLGRW